MSWAKVLGSLGKSFRQKSDGTLMVEVLNQPVPAPPPEVQVTVSGQDTLRPYPPRITAELLSSAEHAWNIPQWLDHDGVYWGGTSGAAGKVIKFESPADVPHNPVTVMDSPSITVGGEEFRVSLSSLLVTRTGRIVWCSPVEELGGVMQQGRVFISDEGYTGWTEAFAYDWGYTAPFYGQSQFGDTIVLSSYGVRNVPNQQPTQVIASFDGETFTEIGNFGQVANRHVHDVAVDPWASNRIWVSTGDGGGANSNIGYTDNRGETWTWLWEWDDPAARQPTQIVPTPHGVMFMTDGNPDGADWWPRPQGISQPPVTGADLQIGWFKTEGNQFHMVMRRGWTWTDFDTTEQLYLQGGGREGSAPAGQGRPRIFASADGLTLHEIWSGDDGDGGVHWIVGPHPQDETRTFFAATSRTGGQHLLIGQLPRFAK